MKVLLVGMMGAGKTTVGHALSDLTGWPYLDNDELVERAAGQPAREVLERSDADTLHRLEVEALDLVLSEPPPVVAGVAGGAVLDPEARLRMREGAFVVFLRAPLSVLAERVEQGGDRPWLDDDPLTALTRLYEGREPLYTEVAHLVIDVDDLTPEDAAGRIVSALTQIRDEPENRRFVMTAASGAEAELLYERRDDRLYLIHTEVPEAFRGHGAGGLLVGAAVEAARAEGRVIVPWCPFARRWLREHPDVAATVTIDWKEAPP